jgi:hypothetical protein
LKIYHLAALLHAWLPSKQSSLYVVILRMHKNVKAKLTRVDKCYCKNSMQKIDGTIWEKDLLQKTVISASC